MTTNSPFDYWNWLFRGFQGKPGYKRIINYWIIIHVLIGIIISLIVDVDLKDAANTVLLPLAGILIGLAFAWAGNASSLMQSVEFQEFSDKHEGGFVEYVYTYQTAILVILLTLVVWGFAGLNVFDNQWPRKSAPVEFFVIKTILFAISSLTIRECWHAVMGAQWMIITQKGIRDENKRNNNKKTPEKHFE